MNSTGTLPITSRVSTRPSAISGPLLTTSRSGAVGKSGLVVSVLGTKVLIERPTRGSQKEVHAPHPAELDGLTGRQTPSLEELGRKQELSLALELSTRETRIFHPRRASVASRCSTVARPCSSAL